VTANLDDLRIDRSGAGEGRPRAALWAVAAVTLLALAAGGWWWLRRGAAAPVETAVAVEAAGARGERTVLDASGYVTARRQATVSSKIAGKVAEVLVEEGMAVDAGQVLARLDDAAARRYLALAEAELAAARRALRETEVGLTEARLRQRRTGDLVGQGITSQADLDAVAAEADSLAARLATGREQVTVAERAVAVRRQDLDDTVIRAPFTGVAISKDAQPGETISPLSGGGGFTRTGICTLVDMASLEVEVDVNESYISRVRPGQRVTATLDAYPDWAIPAAVITTIPAADRQKATVKVRVAFEALDPRILPDMGVKVAFHAEPEAGAAAAERPAVLVPRTAVRGAPGSEVVFVVRDGRAERRAVRVGGTRGEQTEIVAGVAPGEEVVAAGPPDLADGAPVAVRATS
jgi:RND family efflux transporter MFP subunit